MSSPKKMSGYVCIVQIMTKVTRSFSTCVVKQKWRLPPGGKWQNSFTMLITSNN